MARSPTFVTLLLGFFALSASVSAQSLRDLPTCAQPCATTAAIAAGCASLTDAACLCKTNAFTTATQTCSGTVCPREDQSSVIGILRDFCSSVTTTSQTSSNTPTKATPSPPITTRSSTTSPTPATSTSSQPATVTNTSSTTPSSTLTTPSVTSTPTPVTTSLSLTSGGTTLVVSPSSTVVVLSTSTADLLPTGNAAVGMNTREGVGAFGALVVGLLALF